nr:adenosylcobinamide-GDP ribazoletransferase [Lysinibacillus timonensis]
MKRIIISIFLAFQFFTSIPIRKQFQMNTITVTGMFFWLPLISIFMGLTNVLLFYVNEQFFQFSNLFLAVILVITGIVMTGGLHLDGWIDMCDAFFSYRDQKRRIEILSDSRVGAFGAIGLIVILLLKITFYYEMLTLNINPFIYFVFIPMLSRITMLVYFLTTQTVKSDGLAAYFKTQVIHKVIWISVFLYTVLVITVALYEFNIHLLLLLVGVLLYIVSYARWSKRHFGGMTGDLLGAIYESCETFLWGILLLMFKLF